MNLFDYYRRQAGKEFSAGARLAALAGESLIFLFAIPASLFLIAASGHERWRFNSPPALSIACLLGAALGLSFALWTVWAQFHHARGTPVPIMATKKLLTRGPYSVCRNPMALGTLVFYLSVAVFAASFKAMFVVLVFAILLLAYNKFIEEKEMTLRFGDEYSGYRQSTPFLIPRWSSRTRKSTT